MRKSIMIFNIFFILMSLLPITTLAQAEDKLPVEPYEKVAAKNGSWYSEQIQNNGKANLVIGYTGRYKESADNAIEFRLNEEVKLSGIYIPVIGRPDGQITISIKDVKGNVYKGFSEAEIINKVQEDNDILYEESNYVYVFTPTTDISLPNGKYSILIEGASNFTGEFLVKGFNRNAYEKYKKELALIQNSEVGNEKQEVEQSFGTESLDNDNKTTYDYGEYKAGNMPVFSLDSEYMIDEIIVSTYNQGKGAIPGIISILNESKAVVYSGQSYGADIAGIANSAWKVSPEKVLPKGIYYIGISQPSVLSYDESGEPLFYVKASLPVEIRESFTGTYRINLDAFKTSTLMGPVNSKIASFSLKSFELTVLDMGKEIELIGQYEGMPFSQRCEVIEDGNRKIVAKFNFRADLTKLPYNTDITAKANVTFIKEEYGTVKISIDGNAVYDRAASAKKGADHNTYDVKASGIMTQKELPAFVMTALGKSGGAGNIPGPDNAAQAAAGMLFPPLAGVVVSVLQDLLKPKAVIKDKNWYKKKFPDLSDEQIAMVMMADAMGSTDNPDEGDLVSSGDGEEESSGLSEDSSEEDVESSGDGSEEGYDTSDDGSSEDSYKENQYSSEDNYNAESTENTPEQEPASGSPKTESEAADEPQIEQEPESIVVQTSPNGAQTLFVKDPKTGEWVDPETNSVLDIEKHKEVLKQWEKEKQWNDAEFEKSSAGETEYDKIVRENMKKIADKEKQDNYMNTLKSKYGTDDVEEINRIVAERQKNDAKWADIWNRNDKILGVAEVGAVAVGTAADVGIDGLSNVVPGGKAIRIGYKVAKGVAGTMAEAGAKGKDAVTLANLVEGGIKGGTDAALDFIPGSGVKTVAKKATATVLGEGAGSAAGAAIRGDNVKKALTDGLKSGAYKAAVGAVTDSVAGDVPEAIISKGSLKIVPTMKNVIVSKAGGTKVASTLTDEYVVKPIIMGD